MEFVEDPNGDKWYIDSQGRGFVFDSNLNNVLNEWSNIDGTAATRSSTDIKYENGKVSIYTSDNDAILNIDKSVVDSSAIDIIVTPEALKAERLLIVKNGATELIRVEFNNAESTLNIGNPKPALTYGNPKLEASVFVTTGQSFKKSGLSIC